MTHLRWFTLAVAVFLLPACEDGDDGTPGAAGPSLPVLQSLNAQGLPAAPNGTVTVSVQAQSPGGLALSYSWAAGGAGWAVTAGGTTSTATLTAPATYATPGTATVTVTDSAGRVGTGLVALTTVGNSAPIIHTISASPNPVPIPDAMTVTATTSDPNGDVLVHTWTVPAGFTLLSGQGSPQIQVSAASAVSGQISVSVSDGTAPAVVGNLTVAGRHGWGTPVAIETSALPVNYAPVVATNSAGDAVAVWVQGDSAWAARYTSAGGWGAATLIESGGNPVLAPKIALDSLGNAIAAWVQSDGTAESVWAARFTPAGGWGAALVLESAAAVIISAPDLACDAAGNAFAVWSQSDGTTGRIWMNAFTPGGGWAGAAILDTAPGTAASWPAVAMNAAGQAMAVWSQSTMVARRFLPGSGWDPVAAMGTTTGGADTRVAMSANGDAVAVWNRSVTGVPRRGANRFTSGAWGSETLIDASGSTSLPSLNRHRVAMDDYGFGMAVWSQPEDSGTVSVWQNRLTPSGWTGPALLEASSGAATVPSVAMEPNGTALAAWNEGTAVVSRLFTPSGGWEPAETVDANGFSPDVALNGNGVGLAVFTINSDVRAAHRR